MKRNLKTVWGLAFAIWAAELITGVIIIALTGCSSSIHNQARTITYVALSVAEADKDDAHKVQAIAEVGLSLIARGEDTDYVSERLLEIVESQFSGRRLGLIKIMYAEVSVMVQSQISIDIPEAYRVALAQAFAGVVEGAAFYLQDLEDQEDQEGASE